jgi:L-fucose mutarotase
MLKHIDPLLVPDLLWVLAAMGHGDDLALVDANFPAEAIAAATPSRRLVRLPGLRLGLVARAIFSVLPIDASAADPVRRMRVTDHPDLLPPVQVEVRDAAANALGHSVTLGGIDRFDFYDAAKRAFAVVQVGDARPYGDFLIRKGVIAAA